MNHTPSDSGGIAIVSADAIVSHLNETFRNLPDHRRGSNTTYEIRDAVLGAFSVFTTQSASFLAHQRDLGRRKGCNNVCGLFAVEKIPTDQQIRNLLDPLAPSHLGESFWWIWEQVRETETAEQFRGVDDSLLCIFDGTEYFSSQRIHCDGCNQQTMTDGETRYFHSMVTPILAGVDHNHVLALPPEFITPQDGTEKQDCERNAARRWIKRNGRRLAAESATVLADDLHCYHDFCQQLLDVELNFILVCKPESHTTLYQEIKLLERIDGISQHSQREQTPQGTIRYDYRFVNDLPIRGSADAVHVNWCEVTVTNQRTGKRLYYNTFATNFTLSAQTVIEVAQSGRARWKVENENNNVLKNYGYHLEHNYGHGKQNLSAFLVTLNLLAFLLHTVLYLSDRIYQQVRDELGTRQTFFGDIRTLMRYHCFDSWHHLLNFMFEGLEIVPPD